MNGANLTSNGKRRSIERIHVAYDTIGLWVVMLILGVHAGIVAAALGHETLAPRLIAVIMGISITLPADWLRRLTD